MSEPMRVLLYSTPDESTTIRRLFGGTVARKQRADLRSLVDRVWKMTAERQPLRIGRTLTCRDVAPLEYSTAAYHRVRAPIVNFIYTPPVVPNPRISPSASPPVGRAIVIFFTKLRYSPRSRTEIPGPPTVTPKNSLFALSRVSFFTPYLIQQTWINAT